MPSSSASLPTWWLRLWIALGVLAFGLVILVPTVIYTTFTSEESRYQACEKRERDDCRPSIIWYMAGWVMPASLPGSGSTGTTSY